VAHSFFSLEKVTSSSRVPAGSEGTDDAAAAAVPAEAVGSSVRVAPERVDREQPARVAARDVTVHATTSQPGSRILRRKTESARVVERRGNSHVTNKKTQAE
jgi:hypothetical protein